MLSGADDMKCLRADPMQFDLDMVQCFVLHGPSVTTFITPGLGDVGEAKIFTGTWRKTMTASPSE
jgi:hypothetical protein